jgi:hypothetical protein
VTEAEWLTCTDPEPMLEDVIENASERKLMLFCVACCRRTLHLLQDERCRAAIDVAERFADGVACEQELRSAEQAASEVAGLGEFAGDDSWHRDSFAAGTEGPAKAAVWATAKGRGGLCSQVSDAAATAAAPTWADRNREWAVHADLLRCLFGNPFGTAPAFDPCWRTPSVPALAQRVYDERAFDRLPELADALAAAGCRNAEVLGHLRSASVHVRGCWALDLILGKT